MNVAKFSLNSTLIAMLVIAVVIMPVSLNMGIGFAIGSIIFRIAAAMIMKDK